MRCAYLWSEHKLRVTQEFAKLIDADDGFELIAPPDADILLFRALCGRNGIKAAVGATDTNGTADEVYEKELDRFNVQLQEATGAHVRIAHCRARSAAFASLQGDGPARRHQPARLAR